MHKLSANGSENKDRNIYEVLNVVEFGNIPAVESFFRLNLFPLWLLSRSSLQDQFLIVCLVSFY